MGTDLNNIAHWFPILEATGVLVPKTTIVAATGPVVKAAYGEPCPEFAALVLKLQDAAGFYGYPVFLRTGHLSGKHYWKDMCFVDSGAAMAAHVFALIEFSEMCDMLGLPSETWAVREFLKLDSTFRAFGGMPINRERRYFIEGGKVVCHHPYWPPMSIRNPDCEDWAARLALLNHESDDEIAYLTAQSEIVSRALDGAWSLDWARDHAGRWYAIDMSVASRSFHWDGCAEAARLRGPRKTEREGALEMLGGGYEP